MSRIKELRASFDKQLDALEHQARWRWRRN